MKTLLTGIFSLLLAVGSLASDTLTPAIDSARVHQLFHAFDSMRVADKGQLWQMPIQPHMLLVEPESYTFVSNTPLPAYGTRPFGDLYQGQYPEQKAIGNTSVVINGQPWTMVLWPLPQPADRALELMAHEAFHAMQDTLGFTTANTVLMHMDDKDARVLFRLEMQALYEAIFEQNRAAIKHALLFRQMRFMHYPESKKSEVLMETLEGLAQYTGFKLAYTDTVRLRERIQANLQRMTQVASLARATAYFSGPLYGLLLDAQGGHWRAQAQPLWNAWEQTLNAYMLDSAEVINQDFDQVRRHYGYAQIAQEEETRWQQRQKKVAKYKQALLQGQPLVLDLENKQVAFNPNRLIPLGAKGTVYEYLIVKDWFGTLTARKGALLSDDWQQVRVSAPTEITKDTLKGEGWVLELHPHCQVKPKLSGGYKLVKK